MRAPLIAGVSRTQSSMTESATPARWIASMAVILVEDGVERSAVIRIGIPYDTGEGDWACPIDTGGIRRRDMDVHGQDSLQSLCLAISYLRMCMEGFVAKGGRVLYEVDHMDVPLAAVFSGVGRSSLTFRELETVLVRALFTPTRHVAGTAGLERQPRVGDQGTVVRALDSTTFVVECVDTSGGTLWVANFFAEELARPPLGWCFSADEVSAGVYRASGAGPNGEHVEATDTDPSAALATCREFAMRNVRGVG
jgi:hypothetical protein